MLIRMTNRGASLDTSKFRPSKTRDSKSSNKSDFVGMKRLLVLGGQFNPACALCAACDVCVSFLAKARTVAATRKRPLLLLYSRVPLFFASNPQSAFPCRFPGRKLKPRWRICAALIA
jgi:hypothetical protein